MESTDEISEISLNLISHLPVNRAGAPLHVEFFHCVHLSHNLSWPWQEIDVLSKCPFFVHLADGHKENQGWGSTLLICWDIYLMNKEVSQCHSSDDSLHSSDDERNVSFFTLTLIVLYLSEDEKKGLEQPPSHWDRRPNDFLSSILLFSLSSRHRWRRRKEDCEESASISLIFESEMKCVKRLDLLTILYWNLGGKCFRIE